MTTDEFQRLQAYDLRQIKTLTLAEHEDYQILLLKHILDHLLDRKEWDK